MSIVKMQEAFTLQGWTVEVLGKDYGEDLLVRIFEDGEATPYTFYVQAKSVETLSRFVKKKGGHLRYPVNFDHLQHWREFWDPVFLIVWDRETGAVAWDMVQEPSLPIDTSGKKAKILIPRANTFDLRGLERIRAKTLARHRRFSREREGSEVLLGVLSSSMNVEVSYNPQSGILVLEHEDGSIEVSLFGRLGRVAELIRESRKTTLENALEVALQTLSDIIDSIESGKPHEVEMPDGTTLTCRTVDELNQYLDSLGEIEESGEPCA
ncbi:DUF4365 domain-containing protein [Streptomyces sp. NBC_01635]|uniref:DUF4365 domain-containing protein n=1 Tax=Streptomyces sp. NBC_01635 TaxID=2975904 RepID=UPI00386353A6|nr:DUF4365 domain-containing protein [Streptomyces sp. NBC_01635]